MSEQKLVKGRWSIDRRDLLFEFLKIAYEIWFRKFGYAWVEDSETAHNLRRAIMNRDLSLPILWQLPSQALPIPFLDTFKHHCIIQQGGRCFVQLFNINGVVECEKNESRFKLSQKDDWWVVLQDFLARTAIEERLFQFIEKTASISAGSSID